MPSYTSVHTDAALSMFLSTYENGAYFADVMSPVIETDKCSNVYAKYSRADVNKIYNDIIGPKTKAGEVDYSVSTGSYVCQLRASLAMVNMATVLNADAPQDVREHYSKIAMNAALLARESRVASLLTTTTSFAASCRITASNPWSDQANSDPVVNVHSALAAIAPGNPNETRKVGICGLEVGQALLRHPSMRGGGATSSVVKVEEAAALLGLDELLISDATYNTANEGAAASYSRIWGSTVFVIARVPRTSSFIETSLLSCTFRWNQGDGPLRVRTWDEPSRGFGGSEAIQVELADDEVIPQNDMGAIISSVL